MTDATYNDVINQMQKVYGDQRPVWLAAFRKSFDHIDDEMLIEAYDVCVRRQPPGQFPTIDRFTGYVDEARKNSKVKENPKPLSQPRLGDIRNTERGRSGLQLMMRVYSEGYTDEVMKELVLMWPTHDWHAAREEAAAIRELSGVGASKTSKSLGL